MKQLKIILSLFAVAIFAISCENEMEDLQEPLQTKQLDEQYTKSAVEIVESGIDWQTYINSLPASENSKTKDFSAMAPTYTTFYTNEEDFGCNDLPMVDFNNAHHTGYSFPSLLDQYSNNYVFYTGDILPGIQFEAIDSPYQDYAFFVATDTWGGSKPNVLMSNYYEQFLIIHFTENNVYDVSMQLHNLNTTAMYVYAYGEDNLYLGNTSRIVYANGSGEYVGIKSTLPIKKIRITSVSTYGYEGVDNISFGNCNDTDGDGCLNEDDAHPNSNMSETIIIGGCDTGVTNEFLDCGTTMADLIDDIIDDINTQYNGDNWDELHKDFYTELSKLTYYWRRDRLISTTERYKITSCAWSSNIPYQIPR